MPTEIRRIVFSSDELRQALDAYLLGIGVALPVGYIQAAQFDKAVSELWLSLYDGQRDETHEATVSGAQAAASLIKFCIGKRIPLPKDATKSIAIVGDNVALEVRKQQAAAVVAGAEQVQ
jgi:hypothetical protein